jgi:hypothetical protein
LADWGVKSDKKEEGGVGVKRGPTRVKGVSEFEAVGELKRRK